jgi:hypothetical protein
LHAKERIPGTKVAIQPPSGFTKAKQFTGYVMESTVSSIIVTPIPGGSFAEVSKGFTKSGLAKQGITLINKEKTRIGAYEGLLIRASQTSQGIKFLKWMLAFGDHTETTLIMATYPEQYNKELSKKLKASILSVEWQKSINLDFFEGLTFRVSESGSLKLAKKMGNNIVLTQNGVFPQKSIKEPFVVVGASMSEKWKMPTDIKEFSHQRLKQIAILKSLTIIKETKIKIDNLDGFLIYAEGTDKKMGADMYVEQCLLFTNDGYYIIQAMVGKNQKKKYSSTFYNILQSFKTL